MDCRINIQDKFDAMDDVDYIGLPVVNHINWDFYMWLKDMGLRETRNIIFPGLVRLR